MIGWAWFFSCSFAAAKVDSAPLPKTPSQSVGGFAEHGWNAPSGSPSTIASHSYLLIRVEELKNVQPRDPSIANLKESDCLKQPQLKGERRSVGLFTIDVPRCAQPLPLSNLISVHFFGYLSPARGLHGLDASLSYLCSDESSAQPATRDVLCAPYFLCCWSLFLESISMNPVRSWN